MGVCLAYVWKHAVKVVCLQFGMKKVVEKEEMVLTSGKCKTAACDLEKHYAGQI